MLNKAGLDFSSAGLAFPLAHGTRRMWRSSKNPPKAKKSILPPSERQLFWNKSDREVSRSQFRTLQKEWTSVTRQPVEAEVAAVTTAAKTSQPAWMSYRTNGPKAPPIYFRTKSTDTKKKS